jgi:hypothetical protein
MICEEFRRLGAWVLPMPPNAGFDYLVGWRGHLIPVEVKDGTKPPSARKLTENEEDTRNALEWRGIRYWVVLSLEDVVAVMKANG